MADATAALWMPTLVRSIQNDAPGINVRMPLTTRELRPMLLHGDIDIAVGFFQCRRSTFRKPYPLATAPSAMNGCILVTMSA